MPCVDTICNSVHCLEGPAELLLAVVHGCFCLHLESFSSVTTHGFLIIGVIFLFIFFFFYIYIFKLCVLRVEKIQVIGFICIKWKQLLGQLALRCGAVLPGEEVCCQHGCRPYARARSFPLIRVVGWVLRIATRQEIPSRAVEDVTGRGKTS